MPLWMPPRYVAARGLWGKPPHAEVRVVGNMGWRTRSTHACQGAGRFKRKCSLTPFRPCFPVSLALFAVKWGRRWLSRSSNAFCGLGFKTIIRVAEEGLEREKWMSLLRIALGVAVLIGTLAPTSPALAGIIGDHLIGCQPEVMSPSPIEAAGHTRRSVVTLDETSLAGLDGLLIRKCEPALNVSINSPALNAAVANGMFVMLDNRLPTGTQFLPGAPDLRIVEDDSFICRDGVPPSDSPILSGPGGVLHADSLPTGGICGVSVALEWDSPPADMTRLVNDPKGDLVAFAYPHGKGWVALSFSQWYVPVTYSGHESLPFAEGARTYYTNTISWLMGNVSELELTCADEGYTGTKLTWCQNICERNYEGRALDIWIHRWIQRYRSLPNCALSGHEE